MNENISQQLLEEMQEIKNNVASMQGDLKRIENNMASTQGDIRRIENNMATKQDVERIDNKLDSITKHIVRDSKQLSELENIKDIQERQEKILETLALRSIEQESDLKDLHRAK